MLTRYSHFISISGTLSILEEKEQSRINSDLAGIIGWDSIQDVLKMHGLKLGNKLGKNKRELLRGYSIPVQNAFLSGNHERVRVILDPELTEIAKRKIQNTIQESKTSPGSIYEMFLNEK